MSRKKIKNLCISGPPVYIALGDLAIFLLLIISLLVSGLILVGSIKERKQGVPIKHVNMILTITILSALLLVGLFFLTTFYGSGYLEFIWRTFFYTLPPPGSVMKQC